MTQQVFAQFIGLSPASLSSMFTGRTNPSLNVVEAIKKKIPDINTDWLVFGSGSMYVSSSHSEQQSPISAGERTTSGPQESMLEFSDTPSPTPVAQSGRTPENRSPVAFQVNSVRNTRQNTSFEEVKNVDKPPRRVTEIRVFYDDQTWESFVPAKK